MADKIGINRITNANVYMNGSSFLGRAEEVSLPSIKFSMAEHKALGLFGKLEYPSGIDKLEGKIKWAALYAEVLKTTGNVFTPVQLQVRASMEKYSGGGRTAEVPVVIMITCTFKELPLGTFKQHDNVEAETPFAATYAKLTIDGEDIFEVDVEANILKVAGSDVLANYRTNIGG